MLPQMKYWGTATVGSKGQVVIPQEAREQLAITEGDKLVVMSNPMQNGVVFIKSEAIEDMMQHMQNNVTQMDTIIKGDTKQ